jgi:hypothetical protein
MSGLAVGACLSAFSGDIDLAAYDQLRYAAPVMASSSSARLSSAPTLPQSIAESGTNPARQMEGLVTPTYTINSYA